MEALRSATGRYVFNRSAAAGPIELHGIAQGVLRMVASAAKEAAGTERGEAGAIFRAMAMPTAEAVSYPPVLVAM